MKSMNSQFVVLSDQKLIDFWRDSAENVNNCIRNGEIDSNGNIHSYSPLFDSVNKIYLSNLRKIEDLTFRSKRKEAFVCYRNVIKDLYTGLVQGDIIKQETYMTTTLDEWNDEYGSVQLIIAVNGNVNCLLFNDTNVLFPPCTLRYDGYDITHEAHLLTMISTSKLFEN
jgi:hypothetical protein